MGAPSIIIGFAEAVRQAGDEWATVIDLNPESYCAHEWAYTGTAYGGDDERWCGEGRCYCVHCGADGDG